MFNEQLQIMYSQCYIHVCNAEYFRLCLPGLPDLSWQDNNCFTRKKDETLLHGGVINETIAIVELEQTNWNSQAQTIDGQPSIFWTKDTKTKNTVKNNTFGAKTNMSLRSSPNGLVLHKFYSRYKTDLNFFEYANQNIANAKQEFQGIGTYLLRFALRFMIDNGFSGLYDKVLANPIGNWTNGNGLKKNCDVYLTKHYLVIGFLLVDERNALKTVFVTPKNKGRHFNFASLEKQMDKYGYCVGNYICKLL